MEKDCIFCKIINGEIPCYKIYEDEETLAFLDIASDSYGHTLVIPKKHFVNVLDCEKTSYIAVQNAVQKVAKHFVENCEFSGVNLFNASGESAQQSVFHYHIHIVPRKTDDGLDMWPLKEKKDINLNEVCDKLKI